jgi:hypothetical protein
LKKKRSLKDLFQSFPTRVTLGNSHDVGWRWKGARRKKLEAEDKRLFGKILPPAEMHHVSIKWSEKGRGFGEYHFFKKDGVVYCSNECDSRETVKRILCTLVDQSVFTDEVYDKTGKQITYWPKHMTKKPEKK